MGALIALGVIALALLGTPLFAIMGGASELLWLTHHDATQQFLRRIAPNVMEERFADSPILVTIPLFTFVCAFLFLREERITATKAVGVALGFLGVLLIAQPWSVGGDIEMAGVAWMIAGTFSVGCSFVYARKFVNPLKLPAAALTTYQIGIAMLLLFMVIPVEGIGAVFADDRAWIGLVIGLGLCGTGLAYVAYYHIVENLGALAASSVTYIPPVVALVIGVVFVGEAIQLIGYLAMCLILAGVALLQFGSRKVAPEVEPDAGVGLAPAGKAP